MAQDLLLGGTGRRAVAHTRPEFQKMPTAPSAFPLLGAPQAPGDKPNLLEGSKSLVGRPVWNQFVAKMIGTGLLVLELLPYMVVGLAHYTEKVGDIQQIVRHQHWSFWEYELLVHYL